MTTKYTSIRSVLYDLSLTIDERYWNSVKMLEWLTHGLRQINTGMTLEAKVVQLPVLLHKAELPSDLKYLTQVTYYIGEGLCCEVESANLNLPDGSDATIYSAPSVTWKPMRLSSNPFHNSICLDNSLYYCTDCAHEFSVSPSLILTTTLLAGQIMVSYLGYALDENGDTLIPDDENLKEALFHYALYRYWLSKYQMKEEGSESRMRFHLSMWGTLSTKAAGHLNAPDVNELENLKNQYNRLVPRENRFQQMFMTLGNRESLNF